MLNIHELPRPNIYVARTYSRLTRLSCDDFITLYPERMVDYVEDMWDIRTCQENYDLVIEVWKDGVMMNHEHYDLGRADDKDGQATFEKFKSLHLISK